MEAFLNVKETKQTSFLFFVWNVTDDNRGRAEIEVLFACHCDQDLVLAHLLTLKQW